jgi:hypothetical protein
MSGYGGMLPGGIVVPPPQQQQSPVPHSPMQQQQQQHVPQQQQQHGVSAQQAQQQQQGGQQQQGQQQGQQQQQPHAPAPRVRKPLVIMDPTTKKPVEVGAAKGGTGASQSPPPTAQVLLILRNCHVSTVPSYCRGMLHGSPAS